MSVRLDTTEALALVPDWNPADFDVQALTGGLTNRTFLVRRGKDEYVLRLEAGEAGFVQVDRTCELAILREAGKAGLAPNIVHADPESGVLVTEFVQGRAWDESDIKSAVKLQALAKLLRSVHSLPLCGKRLNVAKVATAYADHLELRHGLHAFATHCVHVINQVPVNEGAVCCHNDIVAGNVIENSKISLIDWEFACDNDPMFDLASAIGFHNLDERCSDTLLDAYTGGITPEFRERLAEQVRVYDAIQWLWLASRQLGYPSRAQSRRLEELQQRIC